jgi:putative transposase
VLRVLHFPRFVDMAPAEIYATLLDEGTYLCSERTMYRLLAAEGNSKCTVERSARQPRITVCPPLRLSASD